MRRVVKLIWERSRPGKPGKFFAERQGVGRQTVGAALGQHKDVAVKSTVYVGIIGAARGQHKDVAS